MKRLLTILALLCTVAFNACKKESSSAFEVEKVHPDPEQILQQLVSAMDQGASGWEAVLNPKAGKSYTLFFSMDGKGNVLTLADLDVNTARVPKAGTYRLQKGSTNASISFSTGTHLDDITHKKGFRTLGADTSYAFKYLKGDTLVLLGNEFGDELKLINITADEVMAYENGVLGNSYIYMNNFFIQHAYFSVMTPGNIPVQVGINARSRMLTLMYVKDGKLVVESSDYAYGLNRINLKSPVNIGGLLVQELLVDTQTGAFYIKNGVDRITFRGATMPVLPLHLLIGRDFLPVISLPSPFFLEQLPGWSPAFTDVWAHSTLLMIESPLQSQLMAIGFNLDTKKQLMDLDVFFTYNGDVRRATYPLKYTKNSAGTYKFESLPFDMEYIPHNDANAILPYMSPVLALIVEDSFNLDYYDAGNDLLLGQMTSKEHPEMYFTGYFQSYR